MTACTTGDPRGGGCRWPSAASSWTVRRGRAPAARRRAWAWASLDPRPPGRTRPAPARAGFEPCWQRRCRRSRAWATYSPGMAPRRRHRRPGPVRAPGARRHGLRGGRRPAGDRRPLRHDRRPRGLLPRRARRGSSSSGPIRRCCPWSRQPSSRSPAAIPARSIALAAALAIMAGVLCLGAAARPPRLRHRPALAADPGRLHERDRPHDPGGPAAEAAGLLGRRERRRRGRRRARPAASPTARSCRSPCSSGCASLAVILGLRRVVPPDPGRPGGGRRGRRRRLRLRPRSELKVVGEVPRGLPAIGLPGVSWSDLVTLFPAALGIALISFADTSVISHSFAARRGERVDADHELGGPRRGQRRRRAGRRVRLERQRDAHPGRRGRRLADAGHRPRRRGGDPAAARRRARPPGAGADLGPRGGGHLGRRSSLFDIEGLRRLWRLRRSELGLALVAFLVVTFFGALPGIAVAVGLSLLNFIRHAWRPARRGPGPGGQLQGLPRHRSGTRRRASCRA